MCEWILKQIWKNAPITPFELLYFIMGYTHFLKEISHSSLAAMIHSTQDDSCAEILCLQSKINLKDVLRSIICNTCGFTYEESSKVFIENHEKVIWFKKNFTLN